MGNTRKALWIQKGPLIEKFLETIEKKEWEIELLHPDECYLSSIFFGRRGYLDCDNDPLSHDIEIEEVVKRKSFWRTEKRYVADVSYSKDEIRIDIHSKDCASPFQDFAESWNAQFGKDKATIVEHYKD